MGQNWKDRLGTVYSTDPDFKYEYEKDEEIETLPINQQKLIISLDKKQRKGKVVTLVKGFIGNENDLKALGKLIKSKCGVGGSVKNNEILIQGNFMERVEQILSAEGYKTKTSGK